MPVLPLSTPLGTGTPLFSVLHLAHGPRWHIPLGARREAVKLSHWKGDSRRSSEQASQLPQGL